MKSLILILAILGCFGTFAAPASNPGYSEAISRLRSFWYYGLEKHIDAPEECRPDISFMKDKVSMYGHLYSGSNARKSKQILKEITERMKSLETKQSPCFGPVTQAYILYSVNLLQDSDHSMEYAIGVVLHWGKKLQLLTPSVRQALGGDWNKKNKKDRFEILGAYSCSNSTIYIDPTLPPFDVGATFYHELSHLFLDKYVSNIPQDLSTSEWLAMDETMASMHAAFIQRRLGADSYIVPRFFDLPVSPYKARFDLSFFNRDGDLSSLFKENDQQEYLKKRFLSYNNFLGDVMSGDASKKHRFENIIDLISNYYFTHTDSLFTNKNKIYDLKLETISPLGMYLNKYPYVYGLKDEYFNEFFNGLVGKLEQESLACKNIQISSDYLGAKLVAPDDMGTRPSGESTRPSGESTRPSGESTRPSGESTRPSGESTRPGIYVRPCFDLYKKL